MKKKKVLLLGLTLVVVSLAAFLTWGRGKGAQREALPTVRVTRGSIVDKALAVGTIEPVYEISIKSKITGVVQRIFADVGAYVKVGDPLLEVRPDPTPLELAEAKRNVELAQVELENLKKENIRQESLLQSALISPRDFDEFKRRYQESELKLNIAKEKLALLQSGKVRIGTTQIETIIKSPIAGYVLSKTVEVGDPVTPLTSFQEGTVLMRIADMRQLIFKGTVDEIDVGRLREGMTAEIKIGALPESRIIGHLRLISLKAEKKDNATVFPIEITIAPTNGTTLRAGYSANASIIIQRKDSVLTIPERVVTMRNDSAWVKVALPDNREEERLIQTGLSDAINLEVVAGLKPGDEVFEKPVKKIE
ncbi:MAG: efflux RND transporter periplasmic adaptor subunit [candidate division KSB1 bacterium]|nr:efflux RND transporter periplasmic adaptor subunit [candidate division KSB1 bacterium]MDZ7273200.1 efflux RND transporter periplasmic adaptor subunit [candidate division KSB1 bacterium]MDZ7285302.1 efflux RND transporter periplasmic adaptor subunit [candidate division KSB1 bacterium]MDZ7298334.1 efflux RND transporter periplasmic adaptor subunit [candidate division KSB1 bacterium]MDZ7349033.1 efflux RND transporter periplasmic adaptor subunit [candidate division KSB1 bacterium]